MNVSMLEQLGSNASLRSLCEQYQENVREVPVKQWCALMLDDTEELDVNEEVQGDSETQLH